MARMTKAFSYDSSENKYFKMVDSEAKRRRPKISKSQMMVEIIRAYFDHKKLVDGINKESMKTVSHR